MTTRALLAARLFVIVCFAAAAGFALATGWWLLAVVSALGAVLNGALVVGEW